ncbi:MAG TPA: EAL domain-containing protein [Arcobacter sp.]|jgi:EAL domain-containing protein (putative c-di-GMP-specific phosphodiesterase class I)/cellobiose-specific phosphotransferase system component IIC|nr:EAL domain-containing protein [Arcobacter sp.]
MNYSESLFLISLRQAFFEIVPFSIISSFGILLGILTSDYNNVNPNSVFSTLLYITNSFAYIFPFLLIITISNRFGKNYNINYVYTTILTLILYISIVISFNTDGSISYIDNNIFLSIALPIIIHYYFIYLTKLKIFQIITYDIANEQLKNSINSILPIAIIYTTLIVLIPYINTSLVFLYDFFTYLFSTQESHEIQAIAQMLFSHMIWWVSGIQGIDSYETFASFNFLNKEIFENLTTEAFIYGFVLLGGVGATLSLIIAIILYSKNEGQRKIAWYALPFSIFNINEILFFGLPIILNLSLLIPFLVVPIINFASAYLFFQYVPVGDVVSHIDWSTPILVSGYLIGNSESYLFVLLQVFNVILGIILYRPFLKRYDEETSNMKALVFEEKFGAKGIKVYEELDTKKKLHYYQTHAQVIKNQIRINKTIDKILDGELLLHYQPQVDINLNTIYGFESLIRYKNKEGEISGPDFIPDLEDAGYSYILDIWVINKIAEDYSHFDNIGMAPKISINLSPQSIINSEIIDLIIEKLKNFNIYIEILERTFIHHNEHFMNSLNRLQDHGFKICIDDFGAGYSSLQYLHNLPAHAIKIDKALLDNISTKKGKILFKYIVQICEDLGYNVIAEGVENNEQLTFLQECNVQIAQGFYFSDAKDINKINQFIHKPHLINGIV